MHFQGHIFLGQCGKGSLQKTGEKNHSPVIGPKECQPQRPCSLLSPQKAGFHTGPVSQFPGGLFHFEPGFIGDMALLPASTIDAVLGETPAFLATSRTVAMPNAPFFSGRCPHCTGGRVKSQENRLTLD